jgi:hypothetical protein
LRRVRKRLGEFVVRRRTEIALVGIAAGTGALAVGMALKGMADANIFGTVKETVHAAIGLPAAQEQIATSAVENDVMIGGAAAVTSGAASLGMLTRRHGQQEAAQTDRYFRLSDDLFMTPAELLAETRMQRARADILAREAEIADRRELAKAITDHFGGAPQPTTATYIAHNYNVPAGGYSADLRLWEEEVRAYLADSNEPAVSTVRIDYESDVPLERISAR